MPLPLPLATVMLLLFCHGLATRDKPAAEPPREVKVMAEETQKPPLSDYYELLDARTYLRTPKRWVALCALKSKFGKEMKLYEWNWRGEEKGWKVALANMNVASLNLKRLAADAEELAAKHDIKLKWT